ncbi:hypothetical protein EJ08DRAFT_724435 [Tothia fuscella]|uniref:Uncharacterized protein n=1 Tax=Tothia fuscella TaxID=1048955 RepID=A0A9P4NJA8_9PEZI|nr:hypothetical protein EJ08DRAFT_724435 [Tothia fuscella]
MPLQWARTRKSCLSPSPHDDCHHHYRPQLVRAVTDVDIQLVRCRKRYAPPECWTVGETTIVSIFIAMDSDDKDILIRNSSMGLIVETEKRLRLPSLKVLIVPFQHRVSDSPICGNDLILAFHSKVQFWIVYKQVDICLLEHLQRLRGGANYAMLVWPDPV